MLALILALLFLALIVSGATGRSFTSALKVGAFYGCTGFVIGLLIHTGVKRLLWDRRKR